MAAKIKQKIVANLYNATNSKYFQARHDEFMGYFALGQNNEKVFWKFVFPPKLDAKPDLEDIKKSQEELTASKRVTNIKFSNLDKKSVELELEPKQLVKDVLDSDPVALNFTSPKQKVIVEFSSPNIAKPFHVGHLRSTIIGNCIANIKKKIGKDVVTINYLGDWGTQFGKIKVGMELCKFTEEDLKTDPISKLYQAYVKGNKEAERYDEIYDKAKAYFADLESGEEEITNSWNKYKSYTQTELANTYTRLGVSFDEYNWESDYKRSEADEVLKMLQDKGILATDEKGRKVAKIGEAEIPLIKSDDTTLYLLRDLMAVLDRKSKHNFDEMYYVVENGQNLHFTSLFNICNELETIGNPKLTHVKFGRIHGMSTRQGKVVFLKDILDEARERCYEKQLTSKTTKADVHIKEAADILGVSSVVVNDIKQSRLKDYEFSWDKILTVSGDTGTHLQYCYCRLHNLELNSGKKAATECDPDALLEPEALKLIVQIARFEETLLKSDLKLEPCVLVSYLFQLTRSINTAFKILKVRDSEEHLGSQRLLLFNKSKEVLAEGLKLLGLKLITKM